MTIPPAVDIVVCDLCSTETGPCEEHRGYGMVKFETAHSYGIRWDAEGRAFYSENGQPEERRPDCDFGTPLGDVLIEPWVQDVTRKP